MLIKSNQFYNHTKPYFVTSVFYSIIKKPSFSNQGLHKWPHIWYSSPYLNMPTNFNVDYLAQIFIHF